MKSGTMKKKTAFLWIALAVAIFLSVASVRLSRMCDSWDYYNYSHHEYGSQITFAELVRYAMWLERAPDYSSESCINGLRQIDGATQEWALENHKNPDDKVTWEDILPYLKNGKKPQCPQGGLYILGRVRDAPRCTVKGHKLPE
jgi:hypothetical protein